MVNQASPSEVIATLTQLPCSNHIDRIVVVDASNPSPIIPQTCKSYQNCSELRDGK